MVNFENKVFFSIINILTMKTTKSNDSVTVEQFYFYCKHITG